uniref:Uncharacterized protein n=1 Tax=Leersia perrieri TaxID=77586 RepID=A0A0D9XXV9_9ORYZ
MLEGTQFRLQLSCDDLPMCTEKSCNANCRDRDFPGAPGVTCIYGQPDKCCCDDPFYPNDKDNQRNEFLA